MRPYLFDLIIAGHHFRPPSYGVMLAIAFSSGYFDSLRRGKKLGMNLNHIENLFLLAVLGSVTGSRLFHVLFEDWGYYLEHPMKIFAVWEGGYTFYGAVIVGLLFMFIYARNKKIDIRPYFDLAATAVSLGLLFGRIGCFAAGCCWGRPSNVPWAVTFTSPDSFCTVRNVPLHPTQLYESFGGLLIYLFLSWRFRHRKFEGQIFCEGIIAYAILRFIIEFFRGDDYRGYVFNGMLSYSQLISLVLIPFGIAGLIYLNRRSEAA